MYFDAPPNSLMGSIVSPKGENNERIRSWGTLPNLQHFGGRGVCWNSGMGTRKSDKQVDNLAIGPSFGHNLCFKCPNGSCEPILDIYILRTFQWYKELFNSMSFDPYNRPLKIQKSIGTPTPKMRAHLGVWGFIPSHFPKFPRAWNVTPRLHFWLAPLQAFALVTSLRLGLQHIFNQIQSYWLFF
jgi:hypothetical protein